MAVTMSDRLSVKVDDLMEQFTRHMNNWEADTIQEAGHAKDTAQRIEELLVDYEQYMLALAE